MRNPLSSLRWQTEDVAVQGHMPTDRCRRAMPTSCQLHRLHLIGLLQAISKGASRLTRPSGPNQAAAKVVGARQVPGSQCLTAAYSHRRLPGRAPYECRRMHSRQQQRTSPGPGPHGKLLIRPGRTMSHRWLLARLHEQTMLHSAAVTAVGGQVRATADCPTVDESVSCSGPTVHDKTLPPAMMCSLPSHGMQQLHFWDDRCAAWPRLAARRSSLIEHAPAKVSVHAAQASSGLQAWRRSNKHTHLHEHCHCTQHRCPASHVLADPGLDCR